MQATLEAGATVTRTVSGNSELVTLTRPCEWGGWYGTNAEGKTVRMTDKSLGITPNNGSKPAITVKREDTTLATATVTAADRRARRGVDASGNQTTAAKPAAAKQTAKPKPPANPAKPAAKRAATGTTPRNAKGQIQSKKSTPKQSTDNTKESNTMATATPAKPKSPARKRSAAKRTPQVRIVAPADKSAAKAKAPARKRAAAKPKPVENPSVVLDFKETTKHGDAWYMIFNGDEGSTPMMTGAYVNVSGLEWINEAGEVTVEFGPFIPGPKQHQPKHSIRFTEAVEDEGEPVFRYGNLYVMRNAAAKVGMSEASSFKVTMVAVGEQSIKFTFSA